MKFVLYYPKKDKNNIVLVDENIVIDEMYYNLAIFPSLKQLQQFDKKYKNVNYETFIENQKELISKLSYKLPLFDYNTKNIYLVDQDDIYNKVTNFNYRFPDDKIIDLLKKTISNLEKSKDSKLDWILKYIKKITNNINFLNNYNLTILRSTFIETFLNTNPNSREITTCIKPSYLPYQKYQSPYYTKSELISMGLNLGIIKDIHSKPWNYNKSDLQLICSKLSVYEINVKMLIYNQLYILYNHAKSYVQYYSLFGSYYFNSYMRNEESILDEDLNKHINNFLSIIEKTPSFDNEYVVYRFVEEDAYLEKLSIGETFDERSFISTTRNPFYSMKDNQFGFILLKIKLPKNKPGIALLMESYSNYPHEQEVLLPPSRLKLVEINNDFKYYHWNKLAQGKIVKKYIFEYIEPLSYNINYYTKKYIETKMMIPTYDFLNIDFEGSNSNEILINFFYQIPKINLRRTFYSVIGKETYKFYAYFLTQNKVYSKFFFLQRETEDNKTLGDEIYLTIQNPENGNIELLVEIRNIISVNYYHRYSGLSNKFNDDDLIKWLSGLAKSLKIEDIIIHGNYASYAPLVEKILNVSENDQTLLDDFKTIQNIDNPDTNILNLYTADINTYCIDLVDLLIENRRRFNRSSYIKIGIPLHIFERMKEQKFNDLYNGHGKELNTFNYLYKIFVKLEKPNMNIYEFYKHIHLTHPYLIPKLQELVILGLPKNVVNPWHFYYTLKPYEYLYENKLISYMPIPNTNDIEKLIKNLVEEVQFIHENKFRMI